MADQTPCPKCGSTDSRLNRSGANAVNLFFNVVVDAIFPTRIPHERKCTRCGAVFLSQRGQPKPSGEPPGFPVLGKHGETLQRSEDGKNVTWASRPDNSPKK